MQTSTSIGGKRDPEGFGPWLLGLELLLACLSVIRLHGGWHGDFDEWVAVAVLVGSTVAAARELRRIL